MMLIKLTSFITKCLRYLPTELSHYLALESLKVSNKIGINLIKDSKRSNIECFGINFKNKLGLAGGLDKNGDYIQSLSSLGFSFLELGTVTPVHQAGNAKPRLFRDRSEEALINSMGFNNKGVDYLIKNISSSSRICPIAVSIGKNSKTPLDLALEDYMICFEKAYSVADFITINISSPNTMNLRDLGSKEYLPTLLKSLKDKQLNMAKIDHYKPLIVKLSPDINNVEIDSIVNTILDNGIDGIIATNTSIHHDHHHKPSGISGKPLFTLSTEILQKIRNMVGKDFPLIASGGVMTKHDYLEKLDSGADLVQIYSGLIYKGPELIQDILSVSN
ncbi:MAG: quinone-dependent dihydroorotate dehydrogenase [SAR86 cluster bacterium]|nr:quinone-dependent dihydroorotate dehydrogenase [SAR86 cluster bacterium]